jgi:hypothetical protein
MQDLHQSILKSIRAPGEIMEKTPEETTQAFYGICKDQKPYLAFIETETLPVRAHQGTQISHRIRYSICASPAVPLVGEIIRTVSHNNQKVFEDRDKYEFKRGTWTVDAYFVVPPNAGFGIYTVDTTAVYRGKTVRMHSQFEVKAKGD